MTSAAALLAIYTVLYLGYRQTHLQRWDVDGEDYVIFGSRASYYVFRPLSYFDQSTTDVRAHIGPHR